MISAAFLLGLAGSLHCVGMCGPIALALPLDWSAKCRAFKSLLLYNAGRVITYSMLGAAFGLVGQAIEIAGLQKWMTIAAGVFLLALAFFSLKIESKVAAAPGISRLFFWAKNKLARLLRIHSNSSIFAVGLLNGLVPCGLIYAAIAGALTMGSPLEGALFMLVFGLGTWPLMLGFSLGGHFFKNKIRQNLRWVQPALFFLSGTIVLFRAFHLDLWIFANGFPGLIPMCH